jgi:hypothetical protein
MIRQLFPGKGYQTMFVNKNYNPGIKKPDHKHIKLYSSQIKVP